MKREYMKKVSKTTAALMCAAIITVLFLIFTLLIMIGGCTNTQGGENDMKNSFLFVENILFVTQSQGAKAPA